MTYFIYNHEYQYKKNNRKKVRFHMCLDVILIPSRGEYVYFGLSNILWYNYQDYNNFFLDYRLSKHLPIDSTP